MSIGLSALLAVSALSILAAVGSIVASIARRWRLAHRLSRGATLASLGIFCLVGGVVLAVIVSPSAMSGWFEPGPGVGPAHRARVLAEGISELMNCGALSLPALLVGSVVWFVSRKPARRPASG